MVKRRLQRDQRVRSEHRIRRVHWDFLEAAVVRDREVLLGQSFDKLALRVGYGDGDQHQRDVLADGGFLRGAEHGT